MYAAKMSIITWIREKLQTCRQRWNDFWSVDLIRSPYFWAVFLLCLVTFTCVLTYHCWQIRQLHSLVIQLPSTRSNGENVEESSKDYSDEREQNDDDDDEDKEHEEYRAKQDKKTDGDGEGEDDDYDESTKQLIAAADAARSEYNAAVAESVTLDNEIKRVRKLLEIDFGENKEFYPLKGKCFDFADREYVYTLCPFEKASQKSKHGGSETSLGSWGVWAGPGDFKYAVMKYERGQNCLGGPDRTATVHLKCDITNELVSVSEPNRCEYRFVFNTPAMCSQPPEPLDKDPTHEDL